MIHLSNIRPIAVALLRHLANLIEGEDYCPECAERDERIIALQDAWRNEVSTTLQFWELHLKDVHRLALIRAEKAARKKIEAGE